MTRLTFDQLLIVNLKERLPKGVRGYMTKESAYLALKEFSGEDFGDDIEAWERWYKDNKKSLKETIKKRGFGSWKP